MGYEAGAVGIEPTTIPLTGERSTKSELRAMMGYWVQYPQS